MSNAAAHRQRPVAPTNSVSDSLRQEALNMERRLLFVQNMQEQARLKFEQRRAKNQGLLWETSRPVSIRKLAENILKSADRKVPLTLKNRTPVLFERRSLGNSIHHSKPSCRTNLPNTCLKVTLSPIHTPTEDRKRGSNLAEGESFNEAESRRSFQEAREQWLATRQKKSPECEGMKPKFSQLVSVEAVTIPRNRICCYHCYKLLFSDEAYRESITSKDFCNEDCANRYFDENRMSCQKEKCYKAFFRKDGIIDNAKLFCSEKCKPKLKN